MDFGSGLAGQFWLNVSHVVEVKLLARTVVSSEVLTKVKSASDLIHMVLAGLSSSQAAAQRVSFSLWLVARGLLSSLSH